jgi:hypothetical protein
MKKRNVDPASSEFKHRFQEDGKPSRIPRKCIPRMASHYERHGVRLATDTKDVVLLVQNGQKIEMKKWYISCRSGSGLSNTYWINEGSCGHVSDWGDPVPVQL